MTRKEKVFDYVIIKFILRQNNGNKISSEEFLNAPI